MHLFILILLINKKTRELITIYIDEDCINNKIFFRHYIISKSCRTKQNLSNMIGINRSKRCIQKTRFYVFR